jgi:hypothetical protein
MTTRSPYHPAVAFDDLVEHGLGIARQPIDALYTLLSRAYGRRPSRSRVIGGIADTTARSFFAGGVTYEVLGEDAAPVELPLYGRIYQAVADSLPAPKLARVDDVASYTDFRAARREPYLAALAARLAALEEAFAAHVADHHADGRVAALEEALERHIAECVNGGEPIDLPIAACASGEIECWRDGSEILCTVRVPCADGQMRMITSGTPVDAHAAEVVGYAEDEDVAPDDLLSVGGTVLEVVGAARLIDQVTAVADEVIDRCAGAPGTVALVPAVDPALAAAMMLLQRCQRGDWMACAEAHRMQREHGELLSEAAARLLSAQRVARGRIQ